MKVVFISSFFIRAHPRGDHSDVAWDEWHVGRRKLGMEWRCSADLS